MAWVATLVMGLLALQVIPPPFPRAGANKLLENERVTVWDLVWAKADPTPLHRHELDLLGVVLDEFHLQGTFPDGSSRPGQPLKRGDTLFQARGMVHKEESLIEVSHAIGVELKDSPAPTIRAIPDLPNAFPSEGARLLLDNNRVAVWDVRWVSGRPGLLHFHTRDTVVIPMENGRLRVTRPDGSNRDVTQRMGEAIFARGNESHCEEATERSPRAIIVELK